MSTKDSDWIRRAACAGTGGDAFFPDTDQNHDTSGYYFARRVCANCPVRQECLDYAIENHLDYGVWGGLGERSRRMLRYKRSAA